MKLIKNLAITLISAASISIASAGDFKTDFEAAKSEAAKSNKAMLVIFTGSDWCPPCKALHKNIFAKKDFVKGAEKNFVIVELDFPQKKKQSDAIKKQNKELLKKYKVGGYPTVLLMDSKGKVFKTADRPNTVKAYLAMLDTSLKALRFR